MIITLFKLGDDILICLENKSINIIFVAKSGDEEQRQLSSGK